jgi:hypothetical protein
MKFTDIREYPTTNTIKPPTKERKILKAAQTPESSTTLKMLDVLVHQREKKEFEDEHDEYLKETEAKRKLPGYRSPLHGDEQCLRTKPRHTHVDNRMGAYDP